jgi:hypothetical protein
MAVPDLVRDLGWHAPLVNAGAGYVKANLSQPMTQYCDQNIVGRLRTMRLRTIRKKVPGQVGLFAGGSLLRVITIRKSGISTSLDGGKNGCTRSTQPSCGLWELYQVRHLSVSVSGGLAGVRRPPRSRALGEQETEG